MTPTTALRSHDTRPDLNYVAELTAAMTMLSHLPNTIFLGQGVGNPGTSMSQTFDGVPAHQRLEMPVAEDMQMGMAIGMSLEGILPVCVFPRWNFMLCCANQIINHLDRLPLYSGYKPKVIIRTAVPSSRPFNPGPQHDDDFSDAFQCMVRTIQIWHLRTAEHIAAAYQEAAESPTSTILVEYTDMYRNARAHA